MRPRHQLVPSSRRRWSWPGVLRLRLGRHRMTLGLKNSVTRTSVSEWKWRRRPQGRVLEPVMVRLQPLFRLMWGGVGRLVHPAFLRPHCGLTLRPLPRKRRLLDQPRMHHQLEDSMPYAGLHDQRRSSEGHTPRFAGPRTASMITDRRTRWRGMTPGGLRLPVGTDSPHRWWTEPRRPGHRSVASAGRQTDTSLRRVFSR